jgi:hypothetical protein
VLTSDKQQRGIRVTLTPMDVARAEQAAEEEARVRLDGISQDPAWQALLDPHPPPTEVEVSEFYAGREWVGRQIDPATAEVKSWCAQMADPYGLGLDIPEEGQCVGRCRFARAPGGVWVHFEHLPDETVQALRRRSFD